MQISSSKRDGENFLMQKSQKLNAVFASNLFGKHLTKNDLEKMSTTGVATTIRISPREFLQYSR